MPRRKESTRRKKTAAARRFNVDKIRLEDLARTGGASDFEEEGPPHVKPVHVDLAFRLDVRAEGFTHMT
jgi:hypothetical protein